ncbi:MAG: DUF4298 domain-containing protein [Pelistega sp.]|nr:DUF4298 domain-containing protein [Pelistega sp.]
MSKAKNLDEIRQRLSEMDERTHRAEKDVQEMVQFLQRFQEMDANIKALEAYYHASWMEDVDTLYAQEDSDEHFYSASQDAIWNATQDMYVEKIKLLKAMMNSI